MPVSTICSTNSTSIDIRLSDNSSPNTVLALVSKQHLNLMGAVATFWHVLHLFTISFSFFFVSLSNSEGRANLRRLKSFLLEG